MSGAVPDPRSHLPGFAGRRRTPSRAVYLDRALEALPLFRLSDWADDTAVSFMPDAGGRWRALPAPGDRLPGTFDQDVYVEILHRYHDSGSPPDGNVTFTLHAFLRSMGRRADGRTYEQLRAALNRLLRTTLESQSSYFDATTGSPFAGRFSVLSAVFIDRRRASDRDQLALFPSLTASEPGDARVTINPLLRKNLEVGYSTVLSAPQYFALSSPVARRLYRLLEVARANDTVTWRVALDRLAEQVPLAQRYPSHLQRVLQPAHEMLLASGLLRDVAVRQVKRQWFVDYVLGSRVV